MLAAADVGTVLDLPERDARALERRKHTRQQQCKGSAKAVQRQCKRRKHALRQQAVQRQCEMKAARFSSFTSFLSTSVISSRPSLPQETSK